VSGDAGTTELPPTIVIADAAALLPVVLAGAGIAHLLNSFARALVARGCLVHSWPGATGTSVAIHAVYLSHRSLPPNVRVFIDTLQASVAQRDPDVGRYQQDDLRR